ncbi:MAG TPA: nucleotidyltransferase family protein [Thermoanaerobaculia bacterium]|nr:nucleotidyltransferase family protein [Thermoanaerobaculia bacterium]
MISAIVLAAGESTRFGACKQLALAAGKPVLQRTLDALRASDVDDVVVVLGAHASEILERIEFRNERIVVNPDYANGMSTSIREGIRAVDCEAAFVVLGDQPFVSARTYGLLIDEYRRSRAPIVVPAFEGRRGNPVLIDRSLFGEAALLRGDTGFRAIFANHALTTVAVDDRGILRDVDTAADLQC